MNRSISRSQNVHIKLLIDEFLHVTSTVPEAFRFNIPHDGIELKQFEKVLNHIKSSDPQDDEVQDLNRKKFNITASWHPTDPHRNEIIDYDNQGVHDMDGEHNEDKATTNDQAHSNHSDAIIDANNQKSYNFNLQDQDLITQGDRFNHHLGKIVDSKDQQDQDYEQHKQDVMIGHRHNEIVDADDHQEGQYLHHRNKHFNDRQHRPSFNQNFDIIHEKGAGLDRQNKDLVINSIHYPNNNDILNGNDVQKDGNLDGKFQNFTFSQGNLHRSKTSVSLEQNQTHRHHTSPYMAVSPSAFCKPKDEVKNFHFERVDRLDAELSQMQDIDFLPLTASIIKDQRDNPHDHDRSRSAQQSLESLAFLNGNENEFVNDDGGYISNGALLFRSSQCKKLGDCESEVASAESNAQENSVVNKSKYLDKNPYSGDADALLNFTFATNSRNSTVETSIDVALNKALPFTVFSEVNGPKKHSNYSFGDDAMPQLFEQNVNYRADYSKIVGKIDREGNDQRQSQDFTNPQFPHYSHHRSNRSMALLSISNEQDDSIESLDDDQHIYEVLSGIFQREGFFAGIFSERLSGIHCVVRNTCGKTRTYEINGKQPLFLGEGDLHEVKYDDLYLTTTVPLKKQLTRKAASAADHFMDNDDDECQYNIRIYPSDQQRTYYSPSTKIFFPSMWGVAFMVVNIILFFQSHGELGQTADANNGDNSSLEFVPETAECISEQDQVEVEVVATKPLDIAVALSISDSDLSLRKNSAEFVTPEIAASLSMSDGGSLSQNNSAIPSIEAARSTVEGEFSLHQSPARVAIPGIATARSTSEVDFLLHQNATGVTTPDINRVQSSSEVENLLHRNALRAALPDITAVASMPYVEPLLYNTTARTSEPDINATSSTPYVECLLHKYAWNELTNFLQTDALENEFQLRIERTDSMSSLFPMGTVVFDDIVEFTAWGSALHPGAISPLLEIIHNVLDRVLRVDFESFISSDNTSSHGLPCKQAEKVSLGSIKCLAEKLKFSVSTGTDKIVMRFGLQDGPVSPCVHRRLQHRFQTFWGTMNAASCIIKNDKLNRSHAARQTEIMLAAVGIAPWKLPYSNSTATHVELQDKMAHILLESPTFLDSPIPPREITGDVVVKEPRVNNSIFSRLTNDIVQFQKMVAELESLIEKVGTSPDSIRPLIQLAEETDYSISEKLYKYQKSLCAPSDNGLQKLARTACMKLHRDFRRSHKAFDTVLYQCERRRQADVALSYSFTEPETCHWDEKKEDFFEKVIKKREDLNHQKAVEKVDEIYQELATLVVDMNQEPDPPVSTVKCYGKRQLENDPFEPEDFFDFEDDSIVDKRETSNWYASIRTKRSTKSKKTFSFSSPFSRFLEKSCSNPQMMNATPPHGSNSARKKMDDPLLDMSSVSSGGTTAPRRRQKDWTANVFCANPLTQIHHYGEEEEEEDNMDFRKVPLPYESAAASSSFDSWFVPLRQVGVDMKSVQRKIDALQKNMKSVQQNMKSVQQNMRCVQQDYFDFNIFDCLLIGIPLSKKFKDDENKISSSKRKRRKVRQRDSLLQEIHGRLMTLSPTDSTSDSSSTYSFSSLKMHHR